MDRYFHGIRLSKTEQRDILKRFSLLFLLLFTTSLLAVTNHAYQGGVALVKLEGFYNKPTVYYKAKKAKVIYQDDAYYAALGIGVSEKVGKRHIVAVGDGLKKHYYFYVKPKKYKTSYIKLKTNKRVNLSKPDLSRHYKERAKVKKLINGFNTSLDMDLNFIAPLHGRISSPYGKKRVYNGVPKAPHTGTDIAAKRGTPIVATQSGIVAIRENLFFTGNTIYLDHGEGVISLYCHMSKFAVNEGDFVKQGDIIGYVGTTGRSTGPHLHFGVILNNTSINPELFVEDITLKTYKK
jgi:murein DD-endopeptidase MepM/ murein hydrolase activator NlpD